MSKSCRKNWWLSAAGSSVWRWPATSPPWACRWRWLRWWTRSPGIRTPKSARYSQTTIKSGAWRSRPPARCWKLPGMPWSTRRRASGRRLNAIWRSSAQDAVPPPPGWAWRRWALRWTGPLLWRTAICVPMWPACTPWATATASWCWPTPPTGRPRWR